jgi:hypothetical protein
MSEGSGSAFPPTVEFGVTLTPGEIGGGDVGTIASAEGAGDFSTDDGFAVISPNGDSGDIAIDRVPELQPQDDNPNDPLAIRPVEAAPDSEGGDGRRDDGLGRPDYYDAAAAEAVKEAERYQRDPANEQAINELHARRQEALVEANAGPFRPFESGEAGRELLESWRAREAEWANMTPDEKAEWEKQFWDRAEKELKTFRSMPDHQYENLVFRKPPKDGATWSHEQAVRARFLMTMTTDDVWLPGAENHRREDDRRDTNDERRRR